MIFHQNHFLVFVPPAAFQSTEAVADAVDAVQVVGVACTVDTVDFVGSADYSAVAVAVAADAIALTVSTVSLTALFLLAGFPLVEGAPLHDFSKHFATESVSHRLDICTVFHLYEPFGERPGYLVWSKTFHKSGTLNPNSQIMTSVFVYAYGIWSLNRRRLSSSWKLCWKYSNDPCWYSG